MLQTPEFFCDLSSREQSLRKERMVDIILLLMAIASAISLLVVSPGDLQRKALLALREYEEMELSRAHGSGEDGPAGAIPMNSLSGPRPLTRCAQRLGLGEALNAQEAGRAKGWIIQTAFMDETSQLRDTFVNPLAGGTKSSNPLRHLRTPEI
jgi:hypothetical protein